LARVLGRHVLRTALILSITIASSTEALYAQRPTDLVNKRFIAEVTRVADGDTVDVLIAPTRRVRIRLHGVDTPEAREPFSNQARTFTRTLMFGRQVTVTGKDVDRYDRLVARIAVDDADASESIVGAGLACTFRQYVTDPRLEAAVTSARNAQRGFWAAGASKPECVAREAQRSGVASPRIRR
jgi:micrococcal nuclease